MASEPSQGSLPTPVVTPPTQSAMPTESVTSSSQALLPTEPATSLSQSGQPPVRAVPSSPHAGVPPITKEPFAREPARPTNEGMTIEPRQTLLPAEAVTPPLQTPPPKRPPGRKFSRRTVVIGLAAIGVVAAGGGITWWLLSPYLVYRYTGHTASVNAVAWSPDGKRIASRSDDGTVQVWNAADGSQVYTYRGHAGYSVDAVAWSPDGKRIASGSADKTVQV
jgi:WD domain, G-beta repeat